VSTDGSVVTTTYQHLMANQWLVLRRLMQFVVLLLFLSGPWLGIWIVKGNLNYSVTLDVLPLTDPFLLLQTLLAGHVPEMKAFIGVAIILAGYIVVGGRNFCSWVCPVNLVTDLAGWLRARLGIKGGFHISRTTRYAVLLMALAVAALTGTIAWEMVNPVSMFHRGLIFGIGMTWAVVIAVFLFDLFVARHGWCGHLCPVGAFYSLVGRFSLLRVRLPKRSACDDCMDCFEVCPEPQVIRPALKSIDGARPIILEANCTNCGRCIDVCKRDVFAFGWRSGAATRTDAGGVAPASR
jgi:ferredoxin-type protein NapH